jgi:hypothetical protein
MHISLCVYTIRVRGAYTLLVGTVLFLSLTVILHHHFFIRIHGTHHVVFTAFAMKGSTHDSIATDCMCLSYAAR